MPSLDKVDPQLRMRVEWVLSQAGGLLWVSSAWRSSEEQQRLYDRYVKSGFNPAFLAAKPGRSNHEKTPARAVDVACKAQDNNLRTVLFKRASLRTPIPGEPWHAELAVVLRPLPVPTVKEVQAMIKNKVVDFELTPSGEGCYYLLADGALITYGDAKFRGGRGGPDQENAPMVAFKLTKSGEGYYLIGEDGGMFNFGDAKFLGAAVDHTK